ncbi:MAG: rhomboid family intramembrane serine protease [Chloroflexi bacterium]|nr:MAG: rhomboid family intramembrane serine protease [Chloroflexota bacterium]
MIPIGDEDTGRPGFPIVNISIIVLNVLVFLYQLVNPDFTNGYSTVPAEITTGKDIVGAFFFQAPDGSSIEIDEAPGPRPIWLTLLTSMFMHGGWLHIGGNMLFLFIFGDNIEKTFGSIKYLVFYLVCGVIASLAQVYTDPQSIIPSLGASGAISGVLASYLVLYPRNRVRVILALGLIFLRPFTVPAIVMIGLWAILQFINGIGSIAVSTQTSGVAYFAHIGGFIAGLVITLLARPFLDTSSGAQTRYTGRSFG